MKKVLIIFLTALYAYSQPSDSLKTYKGNDIVVSASRSEIMLKNSPSFVSLVNAGELDKINGDKLADKIASVPGIVFKDYGYGGLKTVSIRGMGAEHTLVMYDGERLNSEQNGGCDLNNVLIDEIEKIEIIRGGSSAYYGSDALGGVINVIPKTTFDRFGFRAGITIGSNEYKKAVLGSSGSINGISYNASFLKEKSDNNYEYRYSDRGEVYEGNRKNSDFDINQFSTQFNYSISSNSSVNLFSKYLAADRGIPNTITITNSTARQKDKDFLTIMNYKFHYNNFDISLSPSYRYTFYEYTDPNLSDGISSLKGTSDFYRSGFSGNAKTLISADISSLFGVEFYSTSAKCANYNDDKNRIQFGSFFSSEIELFKNFAFPLIVFPAIRYDYYSDFGSQISPKIGANLDLYNNMLFFKSGYSKSFRAPTFNDLYWNPGGNPDLKPEKSNSFDCGLSYYLDEPFEISADINYFNIITKDRIIWVPFSGTIWKPKNIKDVSSTGFESNLELGFFNKILVLSASYSYTEAKNITMNDVNKDKLLPYIPKHTFKSGLVLQYGKIGFGAQFRFFSSRYSEESNDYLSKLDYYHLMDSYIQYTTKLFSLETIFKCEMNNLYNSEFVVMPYYPTPLRDYKVSIIIKY
jgi:vitamin B12 transporter